MKGKIRKLALKTLVILMVGTAIQPTLPAQAKVCLSRTKRTYDDYGSHFWDKIKLKNVPSNASIKWKSSAPSVIKIADRFKCGTWYRILKPGKATVTALYKGRKYTCKITVKKKAAHPSSTPKPTSMPVKDDDEDEDPPDPSLPKDAHLNATHVTIYYCEPYAIPYAHDESHPTEFQFKLEGSDKRPVWDVTLDDPEVFGWLNISKDGLLTIPTGGCSDATATVTARYFNDVLTCKVTVINETRVKYDELVNEFIRTHIKDDMSDYEKMEVLEKQALNILEGKKWAVCGDSFSNGDFKGSDNTDHIFKEGRFAGKNRTYGYLIAERNKLYQEYLNAAQAEAQRLDTYNAAQAYYANTDGKGENALTWRDDSQLAYDSAVSDRRVAEEKLKAIDLELTGEVRSLEDLGAEINAGNRKVLEAEATAKDNQAKQQITALGGK